jgi:MFS family permease
MSRPVPLSTNGTLMRNFLSREATVAKAGFNRWLVPPAAIAVHMCIGEVYGFSVFNVPLTQAGAGWTIPQVGWIYSIALFMLGVSAAVFGKWVERSGPRKTMAASCACFCGGLLISAIGVKLNMLWLLYVGYGFIGGIGLGLGYISPVSTLIKWFPDRPGMSTGMAIMGFGGGALIGAPLGVKLMGPFHISHLRRGRRGIHRHGMSVCGLHVVRRIRRPRSSSGLEAGRLGAGEAS